jgi:hypothetical protein
LGGELMKKDRRKYLRYPSFDIKKVFYKDYNMNIKSQNIVLRDESHLGYGAIYVGPDLINKDHNVYIKNSEDNFTGVTISWMKKVANNVFLMGFKVQVNELHTTDPDRTDKIKISGYKNWLT